MSITLGNGRDDEFGYFSTRGHRAVGQRLHPACNKAKAYRLPDGFLPRQWKKYGGLRSVRRSSTLRLAVKDARRRQFYKAMNRNPLYYAQISSRPAGALRVGLPFGGYMPSKVRARQLEQLQKGQMRRAAQETRAVSVSLSGYGWEQIEDLLANSEGPAMPEAPEERTLEWLVTTLLAHWADGWRRPGSWERSMLDMMGHAND